MDSFKLEIIRPGPLHGQLLSKLTYYIALCDDVDAETVRFSFDHRELKDDLESLRYYVGGGLTERVPNTLRAASVERIGQRLSEVLASMRGIQTRISRGSAGHRHLRLVLGGSELSLVPFELATIPEGWPGSGRKLSLYPDAPIVTRELRDSTRMPLQWNREPRILFCSASPAGVAPPPTDAHLLAVTRALRPWLSAKQKPEQLLTVLDHVSLDAIRKVVHAAFRERRPYTHVHLLCHGQALVSQPGRYGLALGDARDPKKADVVDARTLLDALTCGTERCPPPTMLVLASCDGANTGTVEMAGASVAYEMHQGGVPWVIASQLPLTYVGSVTMARVLYEGLLQGDDPRHVLKEVRLELAREPASHDWGSLVAFAAFPGDFGDQVREFRSRQMHGLVEGALARLKTLGTTDGHPETAKALVTIERALERWRTALNDLPAAHPAWSEYFGVEGATYKQRAELTEGDPTSLFSRALDSYQRAAALTLTNHWLMTQTLCLAQLLRRPSPPGWLDIAADVAARQQAEESLDGLWAMSTLLELAILDDEGRAAGANADEWANRFAERGARLAEVKGVPFALFSTRRQLNRYVKGSFSRLASDTIKARVNAVLAVLPEKEG